MKLSEAKEILKNNGYICEAYDAVTDHQNVKRSRTKYAITYNGYFQHLLGRVKDYIKETTGITYYCSYTKTPGANCNWEELVVANKKGKKYVVVKSIYGRFGKEGDVETRNRQNLAFEDPDEKIENPSTFIGSESGSFAGKSFMDMYIDVSIHTSDPKCTELASEKFDVRNVPGVAEWIEDEIGGFGEYSEE